MHILKMFETGSLNVSHQRMACKMFAPLKEAYHLKGTRQGKIHQNK